MSAGISITVVVDNNAPPELSREHGLALWIEAADHRILFDTGQGMALVPNAQSLRLNLSQADAVVLSHGHYDHTGGLAQVLARAPGAHLYCHPGVTRPRYAVRDGQAKPIGMAPASIRAVEALPACNVHRVPGPAPLAPGLGLTGAIPRRTDFEDTGGPFFLDSGGTVEDPIEDDLALWIRTGDGVIVVVGCSHAGLVNTLNHVRSLAGCRRIRGVIGGFHLHAAGRERLERTVEALRSFEPDFVAPCHCTGERAVESIRAALGERVKPVSAGSTYRFRSGDVQGAADGGEV